MSNDLNQKQIDRITDAIAAGRKIEAVKQYRNATGCDLREAKDFVDGLTERLVAEDPERFEKAVKTTNVNWVVLLALVLLGCVLFGFLVGG